MVTLQSDNRSLVRGARYSHLTENYSSGVTVLNVANPAGLEANKIVLLGDVGNEQSEIRVILSVSGSAVTLTAATSFAHPESTRITVIPYDQIRFFWTSAATYDALTPLTGFVPLQPDDWFTKYQDPSNSTGYGWFVYKNSVTGGVTGASNAIPYADFVRSTVKKLLDGCFSLVSNNERKLISLEDAMEWLNEYHDDVKMELAQVDASYDATDGSHAVSVTAGTQEYALNANFGEMIKVWIPGTTPGTGTVIEPCHISEIDEYSHAVAGDVGYPTRYYVRGDYIGFLPLPASDFTAKYRFVENTGTLSTYNDEISLPKKAFSAVKDGWMIRANEKLKHFDVASYFEKKYEKDIMKMKIRSVNTDNSLDSWGIAQNANV